MARFDFGSLRDVIGGTKERLRVGLGAGADFIEKVQKYFVGTMMDARMLLEPAVKGGQDEYLSFDESQS